jgi:uncharacterized protein YlbG (UPF0298 family)
MVKKFRELGEKIQTKLRDKFCPEYEHFFQIDFGRTYPYDDLVEVSSVKRFLKDYGIVMEISYQPRYIILFKPNENIKQIIPNAHPRHIRRSTRIKKVLKSLHHVQSVRCVNEKDIERQPSLRNAAFLSNKKSLQHARFTSV